MLVVTNTEARIHNLGDHVILVPGINMVDEAAWEEALKIKLVQFYVTEGILKVVKNAKTGKPIMTQEDELLDLGKLSLDDALKMISDTYDRALLQAWKNNAKSKKLLTAIQDQIVKVDPSVKE